VRAYERGDFEFESKIKPVLSTDGKEWAVSEDALISSDGTRLRRLPGHVSYWFAWAGYLGEDSDLFSKEDK